MIIDCQFKKDLKRKIEPNLFGGCDQFFFSLSTNGLCYTFNGKPQNEIWRSYGEEDDNYKDDALKTLLSEWPQGKADKNFGGSGAVQGNTYVLVEIVMKIINKTNYISY